MGPCFACARLNCSPYCACSCHSSVAPSALDVGVEVVQVTAAAEGTE